MIEPTYLRYIYDALNSGSLNSENAASLPHGFIGLYEEEFPANISVIERTLLLRKFGIWSLIKIPVSIDFMSKLLNENEDNVKAFIDKFSKWFNSPSPGKYIIYHDRLRLFFLQKLSNNELLELNESIISFLEKAISKSDGSESEIYSIEHLSNHMYVESQLGNNYDRFIKFVNNDNLWEKQIVFSKEYKWSLNSLKKSIIESTRQNDQKNISKSINNYIKISNEENENYIQILSFISKENFDLAFSRIDVWEGEKRFRIYLLILTEIFFGNLRKVVIPYDIIEKIVNKLKILVDKKNNIKEVKYFEKELIDETQGKKLISWAFNLSYERYIEKEKVKKVKIINWPDFYPQLIMFYLTKELDSIDIDFYFIWNSIDELNYKEIINHNYENDGNHEDRIKEFLSKILLGSSLDLDTMLNGAYEGARYSLKNNYPDSFKISINIVLTVFEQFQKKLKLQDYYSRLLTAYQLIYCNDFVHNFNSIKGLTISEIKKSFLEDLLFSQIDQMNNINIQIDWYKHLMFVVKLIFSKHEKPVDNIIKDLLLNRLLAIVDKNPKLIENTDNLFDIVTYVIWIGDPISAFRLYENREIPENIETKFSNLDVVADSLWYAPGTDEFENSKDQTSSHSTYLLISNSLNKLKSNENGIPIVKKLMDEMLKLDKNKPLSEDVILNISNYYISIDKTDEAYKLIHNLIPNDRKTLYSIISNKLYTDSINKKNQIINISELEYFSNTDSIPTLNEISALNQEINPIQINKSIQHVLESSLIVDDFDVTNSYLFSSRLFQELVHLGFEDLLIDLFEILPKGSDFSKNYPYFKLILFLTEKNKIESSIASLKHISNEIFEYYSIMIIIKKIIAQNKIENSFELINEINSPLLKFYLYIYLFNEVYKEQKLENQILFKIIDKLFLSIKEKQYSNILFEIAYNFLFSIEDNLKIGFLNYFIKKISKKETYQSSDQSLSIETNLYIPKHDDFLDSIIDNLIPEMHSQEKIMERMSKIIYEIRDIESKIESKFFKVTDEGEKILASLKNDYENQKWMEEDEIIVNNSNVDSIIEDFKYSIYNDYPYYTIKKGEKILRYFYELDDETNFNKFLDYLNKLIKKNDVETVNYSKTIKKIIDIVNKYPSYNFTKILKYFELQVKGLDNDVDSKFDFKLLYSIYKSYSDNQFDDFLLEKKIVVNQEILDYLYEFLEGNALTINPNKLYNLILDLNFIKEKLRYKLIEFCLITFNNLSTDECLKFIKLIKNHEKKTKLTSILIKKGVLNSISNNTISNYKIDNNINKLRGKIIGRTIIKIWQEESEDEISGEKILNKRKELILEKGTELNDENIPLIIKSKVDNIPIIDINDNFSNEKNYSNLVFNSKESDVLFDISNSEKNDFLCLKKVKYVTKILMSKNIDTKKIKNVTKLIKNEKIYNNEILLNKLLENQLYNEAIVIAESISEKWGIFKYSSNIKPSIEGNVFDIAALDKSESIRSYSLATISEYLIKKSMLDKAIEVANKIDDVYIKIDLFKKLRALVIKTNMDDDQLIDSLKLLHHHEINNYEYQKYYSFNVLKSNNEETDLYHRDLTRILNHKYDKFHDKKTSKINKKKLLKDILKFLENNNNFYVLDQSFKFLTSLIKSNQYGDNFIDKKEEEKIIEILNNFVNLILEVFDFSDESTNKQDLISVYKKSDNEDVIEQVNYILDIYEEIFEIKGLNNLSKKLYKIFSKFETGRLMFSDNKLLEASDFIRYNESFPEEFYQNAISVVRRTVNFGKLFFRIYKILLKKGDVEKSNEFLNYAYQCGDTHVFYKMWEKTLESYSFEDPKAKLHESFISYLSVNPKAIKIEDKIKLHHKAIGNSLFKEMLSFFISQKNYDEIDKIKRYYRSPSVEDIYSKDFTMLNNDEILDNYMDTILKSNEFNGKKSFNKHLINYSSMIKKSGGEVLTPDTLNFETNEKITGGIFCDKIFRKKPQKKGFFGFNLKSSENNNEETIGHINLHTRVSNSTLAIWDVANLLDISINHYLDIEKHKKYFVVQAGLETFNRIGQPIKNGEIITAQENELNFLKEKFISKTGGEAICEMLKRVDLSEKTDIINEIEKDLSNRLWLAKETEEYKLNKEEFESKEESKKEQIKLTLEDLIEIMTPKVIPVIEAKYRPLEISSDGKYIISNLNHLYRRLIIRNNRLKRLIEIKAPEVILRNEKRMLSEAVKELCSGFLNQTTSKMIDVITPGLNNKLSILGCFDTYSKESKKILFEIILSLIQLSNKKIKSNYILKTCEILLNLYKNYYKQGEKEIAKTILDDVFEFSSTSHNSNNLRTELKNKAKNDLLLFFITNELNDDDFYKFTLLLFEKIEFKYALKFYNKNKNKLYSNNFSIDFYELLKNNKINISDNEDYNNLLLAFPENIKILDYYLSKKRPIL